MRHDHPQAWIDTDRLLAVYLEQYPESSSIDLTNDLIAETGLQSLEAMRTVDDYVFRKAIDTTKADWEAVRPLLLYFLQGVFILAVTIGVGHLAAFFLPPFILAVKHYLEVVVGLTVFLILIARNDSTGRRADLLRSSQGRKTREIATMARGSLEWRSGLRF